ncbi:hypothetical protein [Candidatus Poriferisodalis sp.]|uniref:hypothetical protein n=1 Tax=Candidatus Poriferisodalis sp. TaxID=3101277 RepID=UPI003B01A57A
MSTATETATKARINAIRDDDESLRQLSDEELDQVAGGQTYRVTLHCGCVYNVTTDAYETAVVLAEWAHSVDDSCPN